MAISTALIAITDVFGAGGGHATSFPSPLKDEWALKKWLKKLPDSLKKFKAKTFLYIDFDSFCCRTYCGMADAKSKEPKICQYFNVLSSF